MDQERLHADFAELVPTPQDRWIVERACAQVPADGAIVEIGVGNGAIANELHRRGYRVSAVDFSQACLDTLDEGIERRLVDLDEQPLGIAEGTADLIIMLNVLEHLRDPEAFLKEARTALKPGGRIAVATPNINWWVFRLYFLLGRCPEDFHATNHVQFWNLRRFRQLFSEGWDVEAQASSVGLFNPAFPFTRDRRASAWETSGKYLFLRSSKAHPLLGYEQVLLARKS